MMKVTHFKNLNIPFETVDFIDIIEKIKSNIYEQKVQAVREAYSINNKTLADELKKISNLLLLLPHLEVVEEWKI